MKQIYLKPMKSFLHLKIIQEVNDRNLTTDKAAEILNIDPRSFAYLKSGRTMCSTVTLIIYLVRLCSDPIKFLDEAKKVVEEIENLYDG